MGDTQRSRRSISSSEVGQTLQNTVPVIMHTSSSEKPQRVPLISNLVMDRPTVSSTKATERLMRFGPEVPLYFITGADAINDLPDWHQPRELLASCHFIAARRQGTALDMAKLRGFFGSLCDAHIHELATPELEISSTQIRGRIREGRSIRYMVPESVETYIRKEGLYR